jgi:GT2 family glycosyltransferase
MNEGKDRAGSLNAALSEAGGEFVLLVDPADELSPDALYEAIRSLNENTDIDIIYSDEDKISMDGVRLEPTFKPDWSPDYFLSVNYINRLWMVRKGIIEAVGGFRPGFDNAEEYDLLLRATERTQKIGHVAKVLYHSRTQSATEEKARSEIKAITDALARRKIPAKALDTPYKGYYRVRYAITEPGKVSIIIPTKDKTDILQKCVDSILKKTTYGDYEILIVDNQSVEKRTFEYFETLRDEDRIRILKYDTPFNYSKINNDAVRRSKGPYILFLNNDTEVISPEWLEAMVELAQRKNTGAVGAKLLFPDNTIQHAGVIISDTGVVRHSYRFLPNNSPGRGGRLAAIQNFSAVTGACMMMRRMVFEEVGGFDEGFSVTYNDIDLCMRITKKGYLIAFTPYAELYHHECGSRGPEYTGAKLARSKREYELFRSNWRDLLAKGDPFYNPNLNAVKEDFSLKI